MKPAKFTLLFIVFAIGLCTVGAQENYYTALSIPDSLRQNANAVVRLDQTFVTIGSRKEMVVYEKRIVTVLNEKGNDYVRPVAYYNDSWKITKLYAEIYDASGKEIKKIKEKDFADRPRLDGSLYTDSRYKIMGYVPVSYPYTVEFVNESKTANTASIPEWHPLMGYYLSTEKSEYRLTYPEALGMRFKEVNFEGYAIDNRSESGILNYEISGVAAVSPEEYSPSFSTMFPGLLVTLNKFHVDGVDGDVADWKEMGIWMNDKILAGRNEVSETTKQVVKDLVKDIEDPVEKARKIVEFVQENTRYISVQVGIGGIQPISAMEVDKVKYGDCKGLTNYTKSLLDLAGVTSYYTVVESGRGKKGLEEGFASLRQGNHIILCIPTDEKNIFMDCTSQVHPFGFIGDFTDDRNVLIIKPDGGEIVKTTAYLNEENYQHTKANAVIDESGLVTADITIVTKGIQYDNRFSLDEASEEDRQKHYKRYWSDINNISFKKIEHHNDKENVKFTQNVAISFTNYATQTSDKILIAVNMFNKMSYVPTRYRNRKYPMEILRGFLDEDEYTVEIPGNYSVVSLPDPVNVKSKFGTYEMQCEITDEKHVVFRRKFALKKGLHDKEAYKAFRSFMKKVSKADHSKLILTKKT